VSRRPEVRGLWVGVLGDERATNAVAGEIRFPEGGPSRGDERGEARGIGRADNEPRPAESDTPDAAEEHETSVD
jgi:hypothetical protein